MIRVYTGCLRKWNLLINCLINATLSTSADLDQAPRNVMSDQGLLGLFK